MHTTIIEECKLYYFLHYRPGKLLPSVKDALDSHCRQFITESAELSDEPTQIFNIRRHYVWKDASRVFRKESCQCSKPFQVRFVGEPGQDEGDLQREFLCLLLGAVATCGLFEGDPTKLVPVHNIGFLPDFYLAGKMIAFSILRGGPAPHFLALPVAEFLLFGITRSVPIIDQIPDKDVQRKLNLVSN